MFSKFARFCRLTPEQKRTFREARFADDHKALVWIGYFGVFAGIVFISIDLFRYTNPLMFALRLAFIAGSLLFVYLATKCTTRKQLTALAYSYIVFLVVIPTAQDLLVAEISPLFHSNFILIPVFMMIYYPGFKFKQSILVSTIILVALFIYNVYRVDQHPLRILQFINVGFLAVGMGFAGFLLRRRYVVDFLRQSKFHTQSVELTEANDIKNQLLSVLSHDVKSPLNSLVQILSVLKSDDIDQEERSQLFALLEEQVATTGDFVTNTIHWVKSQMNGITLNAQELSLRDLVFECLDLYADRIEKKNLCIDSDNLGLYSVYADLEMTRIAIRNLLNNAIKFSPMGETITLDACHNDRGICLRIIDRGPGISQELIDDMFEFKAANPHNTGGEYSTGIGLVLTRDFMRRIGGDVSVDPNPTEGSTLFKVSFPPNPVELDTLPTLKKTG